jgi:hypothetical protein
MKTARRKTRHGGVLLGLWLGLGSALAQDHWEVGSADLLGLTSGKGLLVAVDSEGGTRLSRDGVTWFRCGRVTDQPLRAVAHGQGKFVAVGDYGSVVTSPDGLAWESQVSGTDVHLQGVAYGEGRFVVAGEIGRIRSSEDGIELSMPEPTPVGGVRLRVLGHAESPVWVERTLDLKSWSEIRSFGVGELPGSVIDGAGSVDAVGPRYYRVRRVQGR